MHTKPTSGGTAPERRCILTGEVGPRSEFIRFVIGPAGEVVPDVAGRLPGRGLWLVARREALATAAARNVFARAARRPARVGHDLPALTERLLAARCIELLSLARRAGHAIAGFDAVAEWLRARAADGKGGLLVAAADAAEDGKAKLRALAASCPGVARVEALTAAELGRVFGRDRTVHVAVAAGRLAARFAAEARRLAGVRSVAAS